MANPYVHIALEEEPRYEGAPLIAPFRVSTNGVFLPTTGATLAPGPDHLSRADELRSLLGEPRRLVQAFAPAGTIQFRGYPDLFPFMLEAAGFDGTVQAGNGTSQVTTLTPSAYSATGGTFTVTVAGETTAALPYYATAEMVQLALEALPGIEAEEAVVTGGPLNSGSTPFTLTFQGGMGGALLVVTSAGGSLTGPDSPYTITPANTVAGVNGTVLDPDGKRLATGSYLWTFVKRGGATAKSLQMTFARPDEGIYERGSGLGIAQMGIDAAGAITTDLTGLVYKTIPDPILSPVYASAVIPPVMLGDIKLTTGLAGTGRSTDFSASIANPIDRFRDLSIESRFPARLEATGDPIAVTGSITKDQLRDVDVDALTAGTPFSVSARWRVRYGIGSSGTFYKLFMTCPAGQYVGGDFDPMMEARRFGGRFDWFAAIDESAGYDARFHLVNGVSATETYV